jgi:signal transduction histidine kinase
MPGDRVRCSLLGLRDAAVLRRQEIFVVGLNLTVLGAILLVHGVFGAVIGTPSTAFFVAVVCRIAMQGCEAAWLLGPARSPSRARMVRLYAAVSIWVHMAVAVLLSLLSGIEDSHYVVLMVIPVIAAASRYRPAGIALVAVTASVLTVGEVWFYSHYREAWGGAEYFEAAGIGLVYLVVAVVVGFVAAELVRERDRLRASLEELQHTRDRLIREEKLAAIGRLAAAIAHEIRNPVAMIVSALAVARSSSGTPERQVELCEVATEESRRLERLVSSFLDYARDREPDMRPTSILATVGSLAELARARAGERGIEVVLDCPEAAARCTAVLDAGQVHQALLNLVVNALEATPRDGTIRVGATLQEPRAEAGERGSGGLELWVENQGEPVPEEVVPRLAEPFFTTRPRGTGLGLAIARRIAEGHGGELGLACNEPGCVRFVLRLPGSLVRQEGG